MSDVPPPAERWLAEVLSQQSLKRPVYCRPPYQHHKDHIPQLDFIFRALSDDIPFGGLSLLAKRMQISNSTLSTWRHQVQRDPNWRPSRRAYGIPRRIFSDAQEDELIRRIRMEFLDKGLYFCDEDFRIEAFRFYEEIRQDLEDCSLTDPSAKSRLDALPVFKASNKFIRDFRKRNRLSLRRPCFKRRCPATKEQQDSFVLHMQEVLNKIPHDRIINIDETNWRSVAGGIWTWATTGSESVSCLVEQNEKEGITVIAAIDAAGTKLPLTVIGKGKTHRCLTALDLPPEVWGLTSESGWTTSDVMCNYFRLLRENVFPTGPLVVLLDTFAAHRAPITREAAERWQVQLVFVPPGCTDVLQPLDRRVFGVLKAHARQLWRTHYHDTHGTKTTRAMMTQNLVISWARITPDLIDSAWDVFRGEWDEPASDESADDDGEFRQRMTFEELQDLAE
jgi:hypothetical protein